MHRPPTTPLPNFLIVGAAKAGTTALYETLARHPDVFLPDLKEPRYLALEGWPRPPRGPGDGEMFDYACTTEERYVDLFRGAANHRAIGEASADTLYYHVASVPRIRSLLGNPKIVVLLREPAARAFSAWSHLRRDGRETLSFEDGLNAEPGRIAADCEFLWHYRSAGRYADAVRNFRSSFSDVLVVEFEELIANPVPQLEGVCQFLGIRRIPGLGLLAASNQSGIPESRALYDMAKNRAWWKAPIKRVLPASLRRRIKDKLLGAMLRPIEKDPSALETLSLEYEEENRRLAQTLGWAPSWATEVSK